MSLISALPQCVPASVCVVLCRSSSITWYRLWVCVYMCVYVCICVCAWLWACAGTSRPTPSPVNSQRGRFQWWVHILVAPHDVRSAMMGLRLSMLVFHRTVQAEGNHSASCKAEVKHRAVGVVVEFSNPDTSLLADSAHHRHVARCQRLFWCRTILSFQYLAPRLALDTTGWLS